MTGRDAAITDLRVIAGYALREAVRRKVLVVVLVLTVAFLALYTYGCSQAFDEVENFGPRGPERPDIDGEILTGSTLLGLAMFVTLFLGTVLAVFVTLNAVRGDAERGLLQPIVVRPIGRTTLLLARFLAAAAVCVTYVASVYAAAVLLTAATGGYWPDNPVYGGLSLAAAVVVVVALALLGTTLLSSTANGIAIFMVFGAGLAAGLIGQIGSALDSSALERISSISSWALPFEAIYQNGLHALTADVRGATGVIVQLGPFGGAQDAGPLLFPYVLVYLVAVGLLANRIFARADL
jgi:Cu-processing system permease protein